jgi:diaminopimelate decarboxylase
MRGCGGTPMTAADTATGRCLGEIADDGDVRAHCVGVVPLDARLQPWQVAVLREPARLAAWVDTYGSPTNLHHLPTFVANVAALTDAAATRDVELEVLFARKADKALAYVSAACDLGIGVDTASEVELTESLEHGCDPELVVTTAAIKTDRLLRAALDAGATIVLDNDDELARVEALAHATGRAAVVVPRFGGFTHLGAVLPTRFGFDLEDAAEVISRLTAASQHGWLRVVGVHCHLDGYDVGHRVSAVAQLLPIVDRLRDEGHAVAHVDIGGGLPVRYVDDGRQWEAFQDALHDALLGRRPPITWRNDAYSLFAHDGQVHGTLGLYPWHQTPSAAAWLDLLLDAEVDGPDTVAAALRRRRLALRCEPGRSLVDGCGLTVARVEHRKQHRDGTWSIGLAMNRTQCASGKPDHAVDPLLVPIGEGERSAPGEGWLTGAYCTESEVLTRRRLRFPSGVARGDLVVFPNTAGYLMHFVESRSHRFPLARNLVVADDLRHVDLDAVDLDTSHG